MGRITLVVLCVWASTVVIPSAQQPALRSATTTILFDVVVRDGNGRPVRDLSPTDFELTEDGSRQAITTYFRTRSWLAASPGDLVRLMDTLAEATGGEVVRLERNAALADAFGRILERYRQRYLLSFTPRADNPRGWHRLDVRLRQRAGTVVARPGYVVP